MNQQDEKRAIEWEVSEFLFDMDGTLLDSIEAVEQAWHEWAAEEGVTIPDGESFHGRTSRDLAAAFVSEERIPAALLRLSEIEQNPRAPVTPLPGALELLAAVPQDKWAVVTSAARLVAQARLAAGGIKPPALLITGDDVTHGKPDPEPYRAGMRWAREGVLPVAFEDTVAGLRSARQAGCRTVGLVGTATAAELHPHADAVITTLADVAVDVGRDGSLRVRLLPVRAVGTDARARPTP